MTNQWKMVPVEPTQSMLDGMTTERKKGNGVLQMWFEALAAAPVPPAGDVEVLAWMDRDGDFYKERCYPEMKAVILLSDHRTHVTRLTADCEAVAVRHRQAQIQWAAERDALNTLLGYASEALKFTGLQDHLVDFEFVESVKVTIDQRLQGLKADGAANAEG